MEPMPISFTGVIHFPRLKDRLATHFVPFAEFEKDATAGTLPDFSLIEPNMFGGHGDYHPAFGRSLVEHAFEPKCCTPRVMIPPCRTRRRSAKLVEKYRCQDRGGPDGQRCQLLIEHIPPHIANVAGTIRGSVDGGEAELPPGPYRCSSTFPRDVKDRPRGRARPRR